MAITDSAIHLPVSYIDAINSLKIIYIILGQPKDIVVNILKTLLHYIHKSCQQQALLNLMLIVGLMM